jgi:uncharacterized protein (TIGR03382 family)
MSIRSATLAGAALVALSGVAQAATVPFTEEYAADASDWRMSDGTTPLAWSATGGPDGGSYASATFNFVTSGPGSTPAIIRGHDSYDSSADAFVGDWLGAGVTTLSFDIRHDAGVPLNVFARAATSSNFPGAGAIEFIPTPSGVWTTISFDIEPGSWFMEGPFPFASVFGSVGNLQFGADPGALANVDQEVTFDIDNVSIVPTPGALALAGLCGLGIVRRRR